MMSGSVVMLVVMAVMMVVMMGGMLLGGLTMRHRHRDKPHA
jgi:hypothetical protein